MSLFWLRVALCCYAVGLTYALVALTRTSEVLSKVALHAAYLGIKPGIYDWNPWRGHVTRG